MHEIKTEPVHSVSERMPVCGRGYRHDSQCSCRSVLSRKSAEKTLGGVCGASGAKLVPPSPSPAPPPPPLPPPLPPLPPLALPTMEISSQSMLSRVGSPKSSPVEWGEKPRSDVSIGEGGWSRMLAVLSIWLWRSSISVRPPSGSTPSSGAPVVLSKKSSRRPLPVQGCPMEGWGEMRGEVGVGGDRWSGDGGEDGEGGSEWSGAREGSGLALKPGISNGDKRENEKILINTGDDRLTTSVCHQCLQGVSYLHSSAGCQTGRPSADNSHHSPADRQQHTVLTIS